VLNAFAVSVVLPAKIAKLSTADRMEKENCQNRSIALAFECVQWRGFRSAAACASDKALPAILSAAATTRNRRVMASLMPD